MLRKWLQDTIAKKYLNILESIKIQILLELKYVENDFLAWFGVVFVKKIIFFLERNGRIYNLYYGLIWVIYSAYKHNDIFDMAMGEDKPMIFISLAYMYALIYITGGFEASLYTTLALGFVLIVVKNKKYTALKEYIDAIF